MKSVLAAFALSTLTGVDANGLARLQNQLQHEVSVQEETKVAEFPYHQDVAHGGSMQAGTQDIIGASGTWVAEKFGAQHDAAYFKTTKENGFTPKAVFDEHGDPVPGQASPADLAKDFGFGHEVRSACVALNALGDDLKDEKLDDIVAGLVLIAGTIHNMDRKENLKQMLFGLMGQGEYAKYGPCLVGDVDFKTCDDKTIVGKVRLALKNLNGDLWDTNKASVKDGAKGANMEKYMEAGDQADFYGYRDGGDDPLCLGANMYGEAMQYGGVCRGLKAPKWCEAEFGAAGEWEAFWGKGQELFHKFVLAKYKYGSTVLDDSKKMVECEAKKLSVCMGTFKPPRCKFVGGAWVKTTK